MTNGDQRSPSRQCNGEMGQHQGEDGSVVHLQRLDQMPQGSQTGQAQLGRRKGARLLRRGVCQW